MNPLPTVIFLALCLLQALAAPSITEFMAVNEGTLSDGLGATPDWIEIYNPDSNPVELEGYILADGDGEWAFPANSPISGDSYLVVFASGRDASLPARDAGNHLHTDFKLNGVGEMLTLKSPSGEILSAFESVPRQRSDISYGLASNDTIGYFTKPTPGLKNGVVTLGFVGDTKFSVNRGYHTESFELTITTAPDDAQILYTIDGRTPDKGTIFTGPVGEVYEGPITIDKTTVVKAVALKDGWQPSNVDSQTYLFLDQILRQPLLPEGQPERWGSRLSDYGMDPDIVEDPDYKNSFQAAFEVFPTLSLAMDHDDLFSNRSGIYQNTSAEGHEWERATSAEFIFPDMTEEDFGVNCGIRIQGGSSRNDDIPKHSLSLRFRNDYGLGELRYPLFKDQPDGDNAAEAFDYLQLRGGFNFAWTHRHYYQCRHAQYNRDQFVNDLFLAMGQQGVHGRWFHLYINGFYWGMYHVHERPDANYMATYFGGSKQDYDAVNSGEATDGTLASWNRMWALARDADNPDTFAELETQLNVDALIDYMLMNFYVGNWDWDGHNWRAAGPSGDGSAARWQFFPWDSEFAIAPNGTGNIGNPQPLENALTIDRTTVNGGNNRPTGLHNLLLDSKLYQRRLADRAQQHFFNGGPLSPEGATKIWRTRSDLMDVAIVAESARWGDYKRDHVPGSWPSANYDLFTKNDHYLPNQAFILNTYLQQRTGIVLQQLRSRGWISKATAPSFEVVGQAQSGGMIPKGEPVRLSDGTILYTLDGSDPIDGGGLSYDRDTGILLTASTTIKARGRSIFGEWTPLAQGFFIVGEPATAQNLLISEIHYHPAAPTDVERTAGHVLRSDFEFLELTNVSASPINLVGVTFSRGIDAHFDQDAVLDPGKAMLLVSNREAFTRRYPDQTAQVVGTFQGKLQDSGEVLEVRAANGEVINQFRFDDGSPWPTSADGEGYSLERLDATTTNDPGLAAHWKASTTIGGSPGVVSTETPQPETLSYARWWETAFTEAQRTDQALSGPLADLDGDHRVHLLEYVLESSPSVADTTRALRVSANNLSITRRSSLDGVTLVIERSADLNQWELADDALGTPSQQVLETGQTTFLYDLPKEWQTGYFRLRATLQP